MNVDFLIDAAEQALRARRLDEALDLFHKAEAATADPDRCAAGRWMIHMLRSEFEQAWSQSDEIRRRGSVDPHRLWDGTPLAGKSVMLRCLHGFGDTVQFLRYMPHLRQIADRVILQVPPRFVKLAGWFDGVDEVITWEDGSELSKVDWDVQIEVMELPYLFRTKVSDLPIATTYLKCKAPQTGSHANWRRSLQVGLLWTAGEWNMARSIPFSLLEPLLEIEGCDFWSLQPGTAAEKEGALLGDDTCGTTLTGLSERISKLDLIITVDSLAAHLAGAMNVPAWVMLQHEADWRWGDGRDDSPWYPSLRLVRQAEAGDWLSVVSLLTEALRRCSREHAEQRFVA